MAATLADPARSSSGSCRSSGSSTSSERFSTCFGRTPATASIAIPFATAPQLVLGRLGATETARLLRVGTTTVKRARRHPRDAALIEAIRLQLHLRSALAP